MSIANAKLYHENNSLQKTEVVNSLEEYAQKMKWSDDAVIIDIGCGDGEVTKDILQQYIPAYFRKMLGCDISVNMVKFANEQYRDDRTTFFVFDIAGDLPEEMKEKYNHAFSFYVFHRTDHQEKAFQNVYNLLTEGGNCLLMFVGRFDINESVRILAQQDKWSSRLPNVESYFLRYDKSMKSESEVKMMMETVGFKNIDVKRKTCKYDFNGIDAFTNMLKSIDVGETMLSSEELDEYMEDLMTIILKMNNIDIITYNDNRLIYRLSYDLLVAYGSK